MLAKFLLLVAALPTDGAQTDADLKNLSNRLATISNLQAEMHIVRDDKVWKKTTRERCQLRYVKPGLVRLDSSVMKKPTSSVILEHSKRGWAIDYKTKQISWAHAKTRNQIACRDALTPAGMLGLVAGEVNPWDLFVSANVLKELQKNCCAHRHATNTLAFTPMPQIDHLPFDKILIDFDPKSFQIVRVLQIEGGIQTTYTLKNRVENQNELTRDRLFEDVKNPHQNGWTVIGP